jgi:hypothetical protein
MSEAAAQRPSNFGDPDELRAMILDGLVTTDQLRRAFGWSLRTYYGYAEQGLPFLKFGEKRLHDPASVRTWILSRERKHTQARRPGRPRKAAQ